MRPWLATELLGVERTARRYTFTPAPGVRFSNGQPMTFGGRQVLHRRGRAQDQGRLGVHQLGNQGGHDPRRPVHRRGHHRKYPWAPLLADLSWPRRRMIPKDWAAEEGREQLAADRHRARSCGTPEKGSRRLHPAEEEPVLLAGSGKPALDTVTWKVVPGRQRPLDPVAGRPGRRSTRTRRSPAVAQLKNTPNVQGRPVPLDPDRLHPDEPEKPRRRTRTSTWQPGHLLRDRPGDALVKNILFGNGTVANSFMMPSTPYYDKKNTPGLPVRHRTRPGRR